jgi:hypothetical protein
VNFGRGGLKKIVEEEDAKHVEAMHYAASAGICVGRENLKLIKLLREVIKQNKAVTSIMVEKSICGLRLRENQI